MTTPVEGPPLPPEWAAYPPADPYAGQDALTRFVYRHARRWPMWFAPASVLVCIAGAATYTIVSNPASAVAEASPTCLLKYTTGLDCPGCGGTRAAWYLLHGDLPAAARHHAIFVFAVPFLIYLYIAWSAKRLFQWDLPRLVISPRAMMWFLAAWGVWSVLRNLPWAPFTGFYV